VKKLKKHKRFSEDIRPKWAVEVSKALLERYLTKKKLANDLGMSYSHICNVMNGTTRERSNGVRDKICEYLGIDVKIFD
jgi:transcriptional regulator with XRE-family HTH domain